MRAKNAAAEEFGIAPVDVPAKVRPVVKDTSRRTKRERQRITREMRAGRECHDSINVPMVRITRLVVMRHSGGRVRRYHSGDMSKILRRRVMSEGLVDAVVAVRCVERKSVSRKKGSRRTLQREVKILRVSTISSRDL